MNQCKVIVIDDDPDLRDVIAEFLTINGIHVLGIGCNGQDAVDLYKQYSPDVVLMDLKMPLYDGFYGLENLQKINSDVKVIMLTANSDVKIIQRLLDMGSTIVSKPFEIDHIIKTINKLTSQPLMTLVT